MEAIEKIVNNIRNKAKDSGAEEIKKTDLNKNLIQPISFCIIYRSEDAKHLNAALELLPNGCEVCLLETIPSAKDDDKVSTFRESYDSVKNITYKHGAWKYQGLMGIGNRSGFSFAKARNLCLTMASRKWVWYVDSDERILWVQLDMDILFKQHPEVGGFYVSINSNSFPQPGEQLGLRNPQPQVRIFLNKPEIQFTGRCHEQIKEPIKKAGYKILDTPIQVQHAGYYGRTADDLLDKLDRNIDLLIQECYWNPNDHYSLYMFAHHVMDMVKNGWVKAQDFNSHKFEFKGE